ncbi:hypothetical protein PIB30_079092, partial [Stylosanthes scabra]|nr:hypothetical protein [Stylosanthes scabra]
MHGLGDMQHFSKWFQAYLSDPSNGVIDPQMLNLAFGPIREYTSWTTDNIGVYMKGDAGQAQNARQLYYMQYSGRGRSNWRVVVKCKPWGRFESKEVVIMDEAYQNVDKIPVRLITETEISETLRSPAKEMDIMNAQ